MIANWMLFSLAVGIAMTLAAAGVERACRAFGLPARFVWGAAAATSLLWPAVALLLGRPPLPSAPVVVAGAPISLDLTQLLPGPGAVAGGSGAIRVVNATLVAGWAVVSILLLTGMMVAVVRIARRRSTWRRTTLDGVAVRISPDLGPAVVGVRTAEIVLPEWALALDAPLRQLVLRHEAEHRDAGDPRLLLAASVLVALVPWNAALWLQARRLRLAVELDCDNRVLARHDEPDRYGRLLLTIAQQQSNLLPALAPTLSEPVSHLERRIRAMTSIPGRFTRVRGVAFLAAAAAAVVAACAVRAPDQVVGPQQSAKERAAMAANPNTTFFSFQVDTQVRLAPGSTAPIYPPSLRAANVQGEVVAQFVVDASGRVDTSTFKVLKSTHELFSEAVRRAVDGYVFTPAQMQGHAVRQLVQLPFMFTLNDGGSAEAAGVSTPAPGPAAEPRDGSGIQPAGRAYVAFTVDSGARLLPGNPAPHYPDLLSSARISGEVVVRFVVNADGRVEPATFQVLRSSSTLFTQAVQTAADAWTFRPAMANGRAVKQLVEMPVLFSIDAPRAVQSPGTIIVRPPAQ